MVLVAGAIVEAEHASRAEAKSAIASDDYSTILAARTNVSGLMAMLRSTADLIEREHDALSHRETLLAAEGARR
jgi:hypothetical protein